MSDVMKNFWREILDHEAITERREMNLMIASDLYKDLTGVRPPHYLHNDMSDEELLKEITRLQLRVDDMMRREEAREQKLVNEFELTLKSILQNGASSIDEALRWLLQSSRNTIQQSCDVELWLSYEYGICGQSVEGKGLIDRAKRIFHQSVQNQGTL